MKKILLIAMTTLSFASCSTGPLAPPPVAMVTWTGTALAYPIYWMMEDE